MYIAFNFLEQGRVKAFQTGMWLLTGVCPECGSLSMDLGKPRLSGCFYCGTEIALGPVWESTVDSETGEYVWTDGPHSKQRFTVRGANGARSRPPLDAPGAEKR